MSTINSIMSRSRESHGKIEPRTDKERQPTGPTSAGEDSPLPCSGPRSSRSLVHVERGRDLSGAVVWPKLRQTGTNKGKKSRLKAG